MLGVGTVWLEILGAILTVLAFALAMARRTKTNDEHVIDHPVRRRLVDFVYRSPGHRLHELWKGLGIKKEKARYHLLMLERAGAVESTRADGALRFFPPGMTDIDARAVLMRGRVMDLATTVMREPGSKQKTLIKQLGLSRKVFRVYANLLAQYDLVSEVKRWRDRLYYPSPRLANVLSAGNDWAETTSSEKIGGEAFGVR